LRATECEDSRARETGLSPISCACRLSGCCYCQHILPSPGKLGISQDKGFPPQHDTTFKRPAADPEEVIQRQTVRADADFHSGLRRSFVPTVAAVVGYDGGHAVSGKAQEWVARHLRQRQEVCAIEPDTRPLVRSPREETVRKSPDRRVLGQRDCWTPAVEVSKIDPATFAAAVDSTDSDSSILDIKRRSG